MRWKIRSCSTAVIASLAGSVCGAQDWTNAGGNAGRNGLTGELGPDSADLLWSGARSSSIAWQPVIEGDMVFVVRQTGFPPEPNSDESPVVALDLDTGAEEWVRHITFESGDWTTWVAGAWGGLVFAARSGNGSSSFARMYALDASTGQTVWVSQADTGAGAYDGVVFADDGDLIVADFTKIYRINHEDGQTVWTASRQCSVSGQCGAARHAGAVYVADAASGGHVIKRFNLATGVFQHQSPVMSGFTLQNTPMAGPDGSIYLSRTQNNSTVDYFYAFSDSGAAITERWRAEAGWSTVSEFGVGPDGSVYMWGRGNKVQRRDGATGVLLNESPVIPADFAAPRVAVDRDGRVFVSNGAFSNGRFYSFNADLSERWSVPVANINIGAPAIGRDGTLVIAGVGGDMRAYRTERCEPDFNGDGSVNTLDVLAFLNAWSAGDESADVNGDGRVNTLDVITFLNLWAAGC